MGAQANPAARDAFKRATDSRAAWLACSASFCAAILESIGEGNRLAISDPATDTLHLSPRDIIIAMTALHGTMPGAEVDALRLRGREFRSVPQRPSSRSVEDRPNCVVTHVQQETKVTPFGEYGARSPVVDSNLPRHKVCAWMVMEGRGNDRGEGFGVGHVLGGVRT